MATLKNTRVNDTGFFQLPVGTVAQRPTGLTTADRGMMRLCTDFPGFDNPIVEYFDGTEWKSLYTPTYTGIGGTVSNPTAGVTVHTYTSGSSTFQVVQE